MSFLDSCQETLGSSTPDLVEFPGHTEGAPLFGGKGVLKPVTNGSRQRRTSNRLSKEVIIPFPNASKESQSKSISEEHVFCDLKDTNKDRTGTLTKPRDCWRMRKLQVGVLLVLVAMAFFLGVFVGYNRASSGSPICAHENTFLPINATSGSNGGLPPSGWIWYNNTGYYYAEEKLNWTSSKIYCEQHGAQLAVLAEKHIEENVKRFRKDSDDHWYGYYKDGDEWKWLDETSVGDERLNNISSWNCGVWNPSEHWKSDCSDKKPFICVHF